MSVDPRAQTIGEPGVPGPTSVSQQAGTPAPSRSSLISMPIVEAILRAFVGGILTGTATGLGTYTASNSTRVAAIAAGSACVTYWIARGGFEGVADQVRSTVP